MNGTIWKTRRGLTRASFRTWGTFPTRPRPKGTLETCPATCVHGYSASRPRLADFAVPGLWCLVGLLFATAGGGARAAEGPSVAGDVALVKPFIGETTTLVVKVDVARLALTDLPDAFKKAVPESDAAYRAWTRDAVQAIKTLQDLTGGQAVYATVGIPLSRSEWPMFLLTRDSPRIDRERLVGRLEPLGKMEAFTREGAIVVAPPNGAPLDAVAPSPRAGMADAFEAVAEYPVQVLLLPPDYVRRTVSELMPTLPRQLGGGPGSVLTEGLVWAALGIDPAELRIELVVQSRTARAAHDLAAHLPKMLRSLYDGLPGLKTRVPGQAFEALLALAKPKVEGDRVAVRLAGPEATTGTAHAVATALAGVQETLHRKQGVNDLKQLVLAMHNYHDMHKVFPPRDEVRDERGNAGLSWRVYLLPFLGEVELYKEFHLEQPWDSPHNKRLIAKMPKVYRSQRDGVEPGHTTYLAPAGDDTIMGGPKATSFRDIVDGTSNTVVLVEVSADRAVPWTAPADYGFDPESPADGLLIDADGRFLAALADGSVQRLRADAEPEQLRRLFRMSDRNVVDWKKIR